MRWLGENVNALLFVAGFGAATWGLAHWSAPLAAVAAGVVVMGLSAFPYLRRKG